MPHPSGATQVAGKAFVPYWTTDLGEVAVERVGEAIRTHHLSQGALTEEFESRLAELLGVPYVVATTSGSMALYMGMSVAGVRPGDEIIMPNRTFVATAHAAMLAGGKVVIVDVERDRPIIDPGKIEAAITPKTRAICVVHLNGRSGDMRAVRAIAERHELILVEDAAQVLCSRNQDGYLGTQSEVGCFSLGVTKLITTGQGGFVATRSPDVYERLTHFRNHGVLSTFATKFLQFGFNLKFTDIQAAVGLAQLLKIPAKIERHREIYRFYERELAGLSYLRLIPVDVDRGELPLWIEALAADRDGLIDVLEAENIQARPFLPDLSESPHLHHDDSKFVNSKPYARHGLWLPCGADVPDSGLERTVAVLRRLESRFPALV